VLFVLPLPVLLPLPLPLPLLLLPLPLTLTLTPFDRFDSEIILGRLDVLVALAVVFPLPLAFLCFLPASFQLDSGGGETVGSGTSA
jgi:hypothetical protein